MKDQELEVKFYVRDLESIERRVVSLGACLSQPRIHEINLRFDTVEHDLTRSAQVLRLRQDRAAYMTYKGPGYEQDGVRVRQEIEFEVSDFSAARQLLQALGYRVAVIYEKFRTVYDLGEAHIALDELPYGNFVEIEGNDTHTIQYLNQQLGLEWAARVPASYTDLFSNLRGIMSLTFRDLIFENFEGLRISPDDLGVMVADE
jgi:adenylate cyclase class 2